MEKKKKEAELLEKEASAPEFWNNNANAKKTMTKLNHLKKTVGLWEKMDKELSDIRELKEIAKQERDDSVASDIEKAEAALAREIQNLEIETKLSGEHDARNAIVAIHAGAGGTESCDWAEMLLRMYTRWAEKKGFKSEIVDILSGEEAGVKSVTFIIKGEYAYGFLQSELGVHRLVRISPFDANKRRHTSFSSVDVLPELDDDIEIKIEDKDLRIDTYRASGHGGQYINKTDSAVRITHLPTGIVTQSQSERSQLKNRVTAMKLLKVKLYELEQEKKRKAIEKHYDEKGDIAWGNQIRSYVFMPYQLVKDHRTGREIPQVDNVMDGEIDPFISAFLEWKIAKRIS
ncbi:MAG: peptide chain release factor 2 [Endomicrobiales bacterium]|nr:peptide chain release factor 2 [Endomicrobiales bacterium]